MRTTTTKSPIVAILVFILLGSYRHSLAQSNVVLGVLEESPGDAAGEPKTRDVRVLFKKVG